MMTMKKIILAVLLFYSIFQTTAVAQTTPSFLQLQDTPWVDARAYKVGRTDAPTLCEEKGAVGIH